MFLLGPTLSERQDRFLPFFCEVSGSFEGVGFGSAAGVARL